MIYSGSESSFEFSEFRIHADPDQKTAPAPPKKSGSGNPGILNADPDLQYSPVKLCPIQYVYTTGSLKKLEIK